ncbi:hypothetical protein ABZ770_03990 [Streptomyces sp. NPDC006654]|uniref:hypothetical protein n=1 Tax=Streptomyces sp. NPDC006654 TaxID=3156897 RepID=UPI00340F9729
MGLGIGPAGTRRGFLARTCVAVAVGAGLVLGAARGSDRGSGGDRLSVGVLLPGGGASRFGQFDRPLIEQELKRLCPHCPAPVVAATPDADVQQQQLQALITRGVNVLVVAAIDPKVLRSSQDADLAAVRRIVAGRQHMTVYKPYRAEATAAVQMAVALGRGEPVASVATGTVAGPTTKKIPSVLLPSYPVTAGTIKDTLMKDGIYRIDQICTPKLRSACAKAGLTR